MIHPTLLWDDDSVVLVDTGFPGQLPFFHEATAKVSLKKLTHYDIRTVICYHGGHYTGEVNQRIAELAQD